MRGRGAGAGDTPPKVELAWACGSPGRKVRASWVWVAPALGLLKTEFVNSRACLAGSVAAAATDHSSSLSLFAVTALRDSGQSFQAHFCGPELRSFNPYLLRLPPPPAVPKLILILNLTHNFPSLFVSGQSCLYNQPRNTKDQEATRTKNQKGKNPFC